MSEKILDGTGDGYEARVDSRKRLHVFSVSESEDRYSNSEGLVWSYTFEVTPTGANDYFFYLKNTGSNDLSISDIRVSSTVQTRLTYEKVTGTPSYSAVTAATPVNRNLGSSRIPTATVNYDANITGLTSEGEFFFEECAVANTRYKLSTTSNILIPQGSAVAFKRVASTGAIKMTVSVFEVSEVV